METSNGFDVTKVTLRDLLKALEDVRNDREAKNEGDLTIYPHTDQIGKGPIVFAEWGRLPGDEEMHRLHLDEPKQIHLRNMLNRPPQEENRWDKDLKTPTGLPMHRSDPDVVHRGPFQG